MNDAILLGALIAWYISLNQHHPSTSFEFAFIVESKRQKRMKKAGKAAEEHVETYDSLVG